MKIRILFPLTAAVLAIAACAPTRVSEAETGHRGALAYLKQASRKTLSPEERAALYLSSAAQSAKLLDSPESGTSARETYNSSAADLTVLLASTDGGRLWNKPLTLSSGGTTWRLRFAKPTRDGVWDPARFTSIVPASEVDMKHLDQRNRRDGIGGALVGVRKMSPPEPFAPQLAGVNAAVTAVLDFKGQDVTLSLLDPADKMNASVSGKSRVIEGDFSAPLAHYPKGSEVWDGLMGAIHVSSYMKNTGLYMLQPYDPDRIPLIFVHGLISTPRMWRNVVNEVESDPELRGKYQCWVFSYPTGNPPAYSALRFREELDRVYQLYPAAKDYVLVGHSMGGLISHMQVTTLTRDSWDIIGKKKADNFFAGVEKGKKDSLLLRSTVFKANPHIGRVIFICTPHRGSEMALGSLGMIGMRLI
ncbi:MAG: alpha/beta fold hydrolase, partial [Verrucomicrobiaceae bacterium]